jgi:hypothetical protein
LANEKRKGPDVFANGRTLGNNNTLLTYIYEANNEQWSIRTGLNPP